MMLALLSAASAAPLMVRLHDLERLADAPLSVELASGAQTTGGAQASSAVTFSPLDDGQPPDVTPGDAVYTAVVEAPELGALTLSVLDAGGRRWSAEVQLEAGAQLDLDLRLDPGGELSPFAPVWTPGEEAPPDGLEDGGWSLAAVLVPSALALGGWLLALSLALRSRRRPAPVSAPGTPAPALPAGVSARACPPEERGALLASLSEARRVVWVGALPPAPFAEGSVFAAPREAAGIEAMVEALAGRGRPLVLVLAEPALEVGEPLAPELLASFLGELPVLVLEP